MSISQSNKGFMVLTYKMALHLLIDSGKTEDEAKEILRNKIKPGEMEVLEYSQLEDN